VGECFSFYATKNITAGDGGICDHQPPFRLEQFGRFLLLPCISRAAWNASQVAGPSTMRYYFPAHTTICSTCRQPLPSSSRYLPSGNTLVQTSTDLSNQAFANIEGLQPI